MNPAGSGALARQLRARRAARQTRLLQQLSHPQDLPYLEVWETPGAAGSGVTLGLIVPGTAEPAVIGVFQELSDLLLYGEALKTQLCMALLNAAAYWERDEEENCC